MKKLNYSKLGTTKLGLQRYKRSNPKKYYGDLTELKVEEHFKHFTPIKIAGFKNREFIVNVHDISSALIFHYKNQEDSKRTMKELDKLLYYLRNRKYGLPDFICFSNSEPFFMEVKYGTSELSKKQIEVRKEIEKMGYGYIEVRADRKGMSFTSMGKKFNLIDDSQKIVWEKTKDYDRKNI